MPILNWPLMIERTFPLWCLGNSAFAFLGKGREGYGLTGTSLLQRSITDTTLVVRIEITGIKKSFVGWWSSTRLLFALALLFPDAGGGSGHGPPGTAISAVYGTVRIEPAFVVRIRAQNDGFIQLAEPFSAGRGAVGKSVEKGQLLATIADEEAARELKQARADLQAAVDRAALPLASSELLKAAEDNLQRLEKVVGSGNVPAVEYEKARSEANRLRGAVETERIERDRNLVHWKRRLRNWKRR